MSTTVQMVLICALGVVLAVMGLRLGKMPLKIVLVAAAAIAMLLFANSAGWLPEGVLPDIDVVLGIALLADAP